MIEEDLTPGERFRLLLWRERRPVEWYARKYGVERWKIAWWEKGWSTEDMPYFELGGLRHGEQYVVLRWRSGRSLRQVAESLGVTKMAVWKMERGLKNTEKLNWYWGG